MTQRRADGEEIGGKIPTEMKEGGVDLFNKPGTDRTG